MDYDYGDRAIAVLWTGMTGVDLNEITAIPLGPGPVVWQRLVEATAIDYSHRIAGFGRLADGSSRAFLLTLVQD